MLFKEFEASTLDMFLVEVNPVNQQLPQSS